MSYDQGLLHLRVSLSLQRKPNSSLRELSRELQVSRRTIQKAIKAVTGKKFTDLRDEVLLERVKSLVASAPDMKIKEISFAVGYRAPRAFARALRRACGASPEELRAGIRTELFALKK